VWDLLSSEVVKILDHELPDALHFKRAVVCSNMEAVIGYNDSTIVRIDWDPTAVTPIRVLDRNPNIVSMIDILLLRDGAICAAIEEYGYHEN